jgi:hypothetical protein
MASDSTMLSILDTLTTHAVAGVHNAGVLRQNERSRTTQAQRKKSPPGVVPAGSRGASTHRQGQRLTLVSSFEHAALPWPA